jgi:hypothetical protein
MLGIPGVLVLCVVIYFLIRRLLDVAEARDSWMQRAIAGQDELNKVEIDRDYWRCRYENLVASTVVNAKYSGSWDADGREVPNEAVHQV